MQLDRQAQFAGTLEHPPGLCPGEADVLAEGVDRIHQAFGCQRGQNVVAYQRHVLFATVAVFRWQGVQAQEAGDRKSVGSGKSVSVRVELGGRRIIKKKKKNTKNTK